MATRKQQQPEPEQQQPEQQVQVEAGVFAPAGAKVSFREVEQEE